MELNEPIESGRELPVIDDVRVSKQEWKSEGYPDDFTIKGEQIKSLDGLAPNTKRQVTTELRKRLDGRENAGTKREEIENQVSGYDTFQVVSPPFNLEYLANLFTANPTHYSAVKAKVANIVGLGYDFVESPKTKARLDDMEDPDQIAKFRKKLTKSKNLLNDTLDSMNAEDTFTETLMKVWTDYEVTGNGYLEVGRISKGPHAGSIGYIGHVPSTSLRIRRQRDGFVQIISNKAVFFRNFGGTETDPIGKDSNPNELIHIKKYAPTSSFYGVPDIVAALQAVAGMEFSARFNLDYFENKAVPRHVITLKGARLGSAAEQSLVEFFETGLRGKNHRSIFVPLPGDTGTEKVEFKIEPVEAGTQDSSFEKYDNANINKILMAHRTPITKVSSAGMNLANARDLDKTFKEQVCQPEQKGICEPKVNKIIKELTDIFVISLNEMTLTDEDTQSKIDERLAKIGAVTRNEIRSRKGQPGIDKGDEIIDMNKDQQAQAQNRGAGNRTRDAQRSAAASDSAGNGRQAQGDGRATT